MLPRRRLFQLSTFDLLLATTAAVSLLVSYDLRAERAFVYTFGFAGGLAGTAIALSRTRPAWWHVVMLGSLFGIASGYLGAFTIEALHLGVSFRSAWHWPFERGQPPATTLAIPYGVLGGAIASVLATSLRLFRQWAKEQREQTALTEDGESAD